MKWIFFIARLLAVEILIHRICACSMPILHFGNGKPWTTRHTPTSSDSGGSSCQESFLCWSCPLTSQGHSFSLSKDPMCFSTFRRRPLDRKSTRLNSSHL